MEGLAIIPDASDDEDVVSVVNVVPPSELGQLYASARLYGIDRTDLFTEDSDLPNAKRRKLADSAVPRLAPDPTSDDMGMFACVPYEIYTIICSYFEEMDFMRYAQAGFFLCPGFFLCVY